MATFVECDGCKCETREGDLSYLCPDCEPNAAINNRLYSVVKAFATAWDIDNQTYNYRKLASARMHAASVLSEIEKEKGD